MRSGVTKPEGFIAGGTFAGIKQYTPQKRDIGLIISKKPCTVAGVFTKNLVLSPSTLLSKQIVATNRAVRGVVVNSGCANCAVGEQGYKDAKEMAHLAAQKVGVTGEEILVASTGLIGVELPMALIRNGIGEISISEHGGDEFARSILTTDTRTKEFALTFTVEGSTVTVGGCAKGSGMIHPNMATMLAFITTDANVERNFLQQCLTESVNLSFNQIDVDGDQSTNDMVLLLANGESLTSKIDANHDAAPVFKDSLQKLCIHLAKEIAKDGEGAKHLIEASVHGAVSDRDAQLAARSIVSSTLVKTAVYGNHPNWGRIIMALGNSQIELDESKIQIFINDIQIVEGGIAIAYNSQSVVQSMSSFDVKIQVNLNCGKGKGTAWGCDMTEEYIVFNSAYST